MFVGYDSLFICFYWFVREHCLCFIDSYVYSILGFVARNKKALKQKLQGLKEFSSDEAAYALEKLTYIN